ncbi:MAG TPA: isoprenylcysteine carboxylmethyltransferase family protein [Xanthobacteraceae bacterium]|nr:isoprenylcysteine carboxylmethyltransferase family protein [Xanthobacteraceae bacterium]
MPISAYFQSALFLIGAAVALFASAGTFAIAAFWVYLAIFAAVFAASFLLLDPGLMRERMRPGGNRPPIGLKLFTIVIFLHFIVAGLDRGRLHLSDDVPPWLQAVGLAVLAAAYASALWAMRVNPFFSSVIRIQSDRGQFVVTTGPYAFIRHPGYAAGILVILASGIALGSWLAAALLIITSVPFLIYRAVAEDRVLIAELSGYRDYAERVRWRLIPGVW